MKKFIINSLIFSIIVIFSFVVILFSIDKMGLSDWAYKRFTSNKQKSLILGTSRSAQGLQPSVINEKFKDKYNYDLPIYNFSFTMLSSPYGELYLNAIKEKLDTCNNKENSLFILSVDPWGLSKASDELPEKELCLGKIHNMNMRPNFEYLIKYFQFHLQEWNGTEAKLNDDGWFQVNYNMDSINVVNNIKEKMDLYQTYGITKSSYRINCFIELIQYLKNYGEVYMCRLPVCERMFEIEDEQWPYFETDMDSISIAYNIPYFTFRHDYKRFHTTDGNHLYKDDGAICTQNICDSIMLYKKTIK